MINMIMFFQPNHSLGKKYMKEFAYYPTQFWHSVRKFTAREIPFYKSIVLKYFEHPESSIAYSIS